MIASTVLLSVAGIWLMVYAAQLMKKHQKIKKQIAEMAAMNNRDYQSIFDKLGK